MKITTENEEKVVVFMDEGVDVDDWEIPEQQ